MIKHIVMWKFKGERKEENRKKAKELLEALPAVISEIKAFEVGVDIDCSERAFDLVLYSEFESLEALNIYKVHPRHVEVAQFIKDVVEMGKVVDYQV